MKSLTTQRQKVLKLLKEKGKINSHDLTYIYGVKQGPTRIKELIEEGYIIETSPAYPNRSVDYIYKGSNFKEPVVVDIKSARYEIREGKFIAVI